MTPTERTENGTKSVERALDVLQAIEQSPKRSLTLSECTSLTGYTKTTTLRLLQAFVRHGFLRFEEESGLYELGVSNLRLGAAFLDSLDLRREALPFLRELADEIGETVHLGVLDGADVVYIEKIDSPKPVRISSSLGRAMPAHSTSMGKAMLAQLSPTEVDERLPARLEARTPATITSKSNLHRELRRVREVGYAVDDIENEEGIRCVAAAVLDHRGACVASISVAGPDTRLRREDVERIGGLVSAAVQRLSERLGYHPETAHSMEQLRI